MRTWVSTLNTQHGVCHLNLIQEGTGFPRAHGTARLAELVIYRYSERPCLQKSGGVWMRKASNVHPLLAHSGGHHLPAHIHRKTCTHPHKLVHTHTRKGGVQKERGRKDLQGDRPRPGLHSNHTLFPLKKGWVCQLDVCRSNSFAFWDYQMSPLASYLFHRQSL